jgi:hypothetical protein
LYSGSALLHRKAYFGIVGPAFFIKKEVPVFDSLTFA